MSALAHGPKARREEVRAALATARSRGIPPVVPTAVLAELLRGGGRDAAVHGLLHREALDLHDVDRRTAAMAGRLLGMAKLGSTHAVDAFVAATVVIRGGGVVVTGDPSDLRKLLDFVPNVRVEAT